MRAAALPVKTWGGKLATGQCGGRGMRGPQALLPGLCRTLRFSGDAVCVFRGRQVLAQRLRLKSARVPELPPLGSPSWQVGHALQYFRLLYGL